MSGRRLLPQSKNASYCALPGGCCRVTVALSTAQWFTGFRISEILSFTVGSVLRGENDHR